MASLFPKRGVGDWQSSTTMITSTSANIAGDQQYAERDLVAFLIQVRQEMQRPTVQGISTVSDTTKQFLSPFVDEAVSGTAMDALIHSQLQQKSKAQLLNSLLDVASTGSTTSILSILSMSELWEVLKYEKRHRVNTPNAISGATFGRVLHICSPLPVVVLQLLVCFGIYFNMDSLLSTYISENPARPFGQGPTLDAPNRITWSFSIKYYYLSEIPGDVYPGQISGLFHEKSPNIRICRGCSTVAISFAKKESTTNSNSHVQSISLTDPWRILILACKNRYHDEYTSTLGNGVDAYLWSIKNELSTARKSLQDLSDRVIGTMALSDRFLFDAKLRDELLFDDSSQSLSKTYFWALQTLRIINECVDSLVSEWQNHSRSSLLRFVAISEADHSSTPSTQLLVNPILEDHPRMAQRYWEDIQQQLDSLTITKTNNLIKQDQIKSLRDGLHNASIVREARIAMTQSQNIRVLTLISIIFLPASFVTSIFGMGSILPSSTNLSNFATVFGVVCGVTYLLLVCFEAENKWAASEKSFNLVTGVKFSEWLRRPTTSDRDEAKDDDV